MPSYVYRGTGEDVIAREPRRKPIDHGTRNGFQLHKLRGERPCTPCNEASNAWFRDYFKRGKCAPGLGWPLLPGKAAG